MLSHSTLDDIEYTRYSRSTRNNIKSKRQHRVYRSNSLPPQQKLKDFSSTECAVCLDSATCTDTKLFPCGHMFHGDCLIQWVRVQNGHKFNCPLCRSDIAHFVQLTGDAQLKDRLTQVWNEHYLGEPESTPQSNPSDEEEGVIKKHTTTTQEEGETSAPPQLTEPANSASLPSHGIPVATSVADKTEAQRQSTTQSMSSKPIWKLLQNFLYPVSVSPCYPLFLTALDIHCGLRQLYNPGPIYPPKTQKTSSKTFSEHKNLQNAFKFPSFSDKSCSKLEQTKPNHPISAPTKAHQQASTLNAFSMHSTNFKAGLMAGLCAGTTTALLAPSLRAAFLPIVADSVPNVAIFFSSYECLKHSVFAVNEHNAWYRSFAERFASAGAASALACAVTRGSVGGMLPLRFAAFFGTFEACKDAVDKRHERLNLGQVAGAAAVGGLVSHSVYYPTVNAKNVFAAMKVSPLGAELGFTGLTGFFGGGALRGALCEGFAQSLSKFLPACMVCSCAFEYSKRYLSQ